MKITFDARRLSLKNKDVLLTTWFGSGLIKPAPGTWGSLAALPPAAAIYWLLGPSSGAFVLFLLAIILFFASIKPIENVMAQTDTNDPGFIVSDEVVGVWITLLAAGTHPLMWLAALCFFRLFDIWKPWPIRWIDRHVKGAYGVMIDDVIAGIFAMAALMILRVFIDV